MYACGQPYTHPDRFFTALRMTDLLFGAQTEQLPGGASRVYRSAACLSRLDGAELNTYWRKGGSLCVLLAARLIRGGRSHRSPTPR